LHQVYTGVFSENIDHIEAKYQNLLKFSSQSTVGFASCKKGSYAHITQNICSGQEEFPTNQIYFQHSTLSHTIEIILHIEFVSNATIIKIINTFSLLTEFLQVRISFWCHYTDIKEETQLKSLCQSYSFILAFLEPLLHLPCYLRGISPQL